MTRLPALRESCAALLLAAVLAAPAHGQSHPLLLWRIDGAANHGYVLGSIHLLRESDYPLPSAIDAAYNDADVLFMELDMDDLDPLAAQGLATELGMLANGGSLATLLGDEAYDRASELAARAEIPLRLLDRTEPWLAAINVEQLMLLRLGFDPTYGIEGHLTRRAARDDKEINGLESVRQQLELLDGLPMDVQRALLMQTLEESIELQDRMDQLVLAWRHGDTDALGRTLLNSMQAHERLYQQLVVQRNLAWVRQIERLLAQDDSFLVVVGALHLVGDDGVPALLDDRGHAPQQLSQP